LDWYFGWELTYIVANGRGLGQVENGTTDLVGKKFSGTLDADEAEAYLREAREGKNVGFEASFNNRTFEVNAVPFPGHQKRKWIMAVVYDITTLKETEAGLVKALEKERVLGEMKSRFVTMASHEFRTPLTTIMSSASLLANYIGESYAKEKGTHITRIKRSIKLLTDMLDNLLSFGRLEDGELKPNYELFSLIEFLNEVTREHGPQAR
jgi:signal transduction histidine kinase